MTPKNRLVFCLLVAGFLAANLFVPVAMNHASPHDLVDFAAIFCCGGLAAEVCLLAIWSVLAAEPITSRIPKTLTLLIVGWLAWIGGLRWTRETIPVEDTWITAAVGLETFSLVSLSLLIFRWRMQRRIHHVTSPAVTGHSRVQFSIGQLLTWTTIVAVILVVGKLVMPPGSFTRLPSSRELLWISGPVMLIAFYLGLLVFSCFMITLEEKMQGGWLIALLFNFFLVPFFVILVVSGFAGGPASSEILFVVYAATSGVIFTTIGSLLVVRSCGFRLRRTEFAAAPSE